jgi:hypothetical protein
MTRRMSSLLCGVALALTVLVQGAQGANSFAGANVGLSCSLYAHTDVDIQNYYAYSLPTADRHALLDNMQAAGMKVCFLASQPRSLPI